jgi:hypothetical protein
MFVLVDYHVVMKWPGAGARSGEQEVGHWKSSFCPGVSPTAHPVNRIDPGRSRNWAVATAHFCSFPGSVPVTDHDIAVTDKDNA